MTKVSLLCVVVVPVDGLKWWYQLLETSTEPWADSDLGWGPYLYGLVGNLILMANCFSLCHYLAFREQGLAMLLGGFCGCRPIGSTTQREKLLMGIKHMAS